MADGTPWEHEVGQALTAYALGHINLGETQKRILAALGEPDPGLLALAEQWETSAVEFRRRYRKTHGGPNIPRFSMGILKCARELRAYLSQKGSR